MPTTRAGVKRGASAEQGGGQAGAAFARKRQAVPQAAVARADGAAASISAVIAPAELPQPSTLLRAYIAPSAFIPLSMTFGLDEKTYLERRSQPNFCNLQLKIASVSQQELAKFTATLQSGDASTLSDVLCTRLSGWDCPVNEGGYMQLDLQLGITQQLLDTVVTAVYARKLPVNPQTAESMLRLADYLRLEWLTAAVAQYFKTHVLHLAPAAVLELSSAQPSRYPALGLFQPAKDRILQRLQPRDLAVLVRVSPRAERLKIFHSLAAKLTPAQCLELLCRLRRTPDAELQVAEAAVLVACYPELALALEQPTPPQWHTEYAALWRSYWVQHREGRATWQPKVLTWEVPLEQLREKGDLESEEVLQLKDGRRFKLMAQRAVSADPGKDVELGLYVKPHGDTVWRNGDRCTVIAMKAAGRLARDFKIGDVALQKLEDPKNSWGDMQLLTRWLGGGHTLHEGKVLPVMLEFLQLGA